MNKKFVQSLQTMFFVLDLLMLNIVLVLLFYFLEKRVATLRFSSYYNFWLILNLTWIGIAWVIQVYSELTILSFEAFSRRTIKGYLLWLSLLTLLVFISREFETSRQFIFLTIVLYLLGLLINRFFYLGIKGHLKRSEGLSKRVIILGYNEVAKKLALYLEQEGLNIEVIGFIEDADSVKELSYYPIFDEVKNVVEVSRKMQVNEIFSTISPEQNKSIYGLMREAEADLIRFKIVPDLSFFIQKPFHIDYVSNLPVLSLRREPLDDVTSQLKKKIIDVVVSSIVTVFVLSWLIPLLGALIYMESPGPIFFCQVRTGRNNRNFRCLKFRSMKINNVSDDTQATRNDSRVTRIGKFIRKTSLDELPQFINVLKGEMSVVGPRPHMLKHTEIYSKVVDVYMLRQFLKPGITGWAQINGFRGEITDNEQVTQRVKYDLWYLENWSTWLDIRILFLTIYNIFKGETNAY